MAVLVTGVAGFIGYHVADALLARGDEVIGLDNLNDYYDPRLKQARLGLLEGRARYRFLRADLTDAAAMASLGQAHRGITRIAHLAAQAGVRHSLVDPRAYVASNVTGHLAVLELARHLPRLEHLVYASSSSVYGANQALPFAESDRVDSPLSLYAATKRADELFSHAYGHLFGLAQTGLRFFTVYGPWGRPDMAYWLFARAILAGEPIQVFAGGTPRRDFTYIDDIVTGVLGALDRPPAGEGGAPPVRLLNIGNRRSESVSTLIALLESSLGRRAIIEDAPRPRADVAESRADITAISALTGFVPTIPLEVGIPRFAAWFQGWRSGPGAG